MKVILIPLLLIIIPVFCLAQDHTPRSTPTPTPVPVNRSTPDSWVKYSSPEGRYSVMLPSQPTLSSQPSESSDGQTFTQYLASSTTSTAVYMIGYFDLNNTTFSFDLARDGMVNAVNGTLLGESAISLGGYPGRELRVSGKSKEGVTFQVRARIYQIQLRVFVLQYIYQPEFADESITRNQNRYFDSFAVNSTQ